MRATASTSPARTGKQRLLGSCAIAAGLAALALGGPALAQVQGSGQVVTGAGLGGATITNNPVGNPNTTQVITAGNQTIINWTPSDTATAGAPIDFLPATNTLNFYGTGQYTVLNRFVAIDPISGLPIPISRQIALNGTVNSYNGSPAAGAGATQGGNIWFYNAGGILIGQRAAINVGSLVLTANDIDTTGGLYGANNEIRFRGAAGSTSSIDISPQSFISAAYPGNPGSSYIALVAPRINQGGLIDVDGSAALVAAEQADITINNGLFDINVTVGAEGGNAITHTGVTGGPSHQQGDTDQSRVYLVAIPKNDAVTMLISGQIGYQDAVAAQTEPDGAVVLSAGYNIVNGATVAAPVNTTAANITIADTIFQSSVTARASGALVAGPIGTLPSGAPAPVAPPPHIGRLIVQGNATFIGDASATLNVGPNQIVGATGNMVVQSNGAGGVAGNAAVNVTGGGLAVLGGLGIAANGIVNTVTGDSTGGTAAFNISGGTVVVGGTAVVSAAGTGGFDVAGNGGDGTGGTASLTVSTGGSLTANIVTVQANGRGGGFVVSPTLGTQVAATSGNGQGGTATLIAQNGGSITANTSINVNATGTGVTGTTQSGSGTGGTATLRILSGGTTVTSPTTNLDARGIGGGTISLPVAGTFLSAGGGDGNGGTAEVEHATDFSSPASLGALTLTATGTGGGANGANATGGNATGGDVIIGSTASNLTVNSLALNASAVSGGANDAVGANASSGNATGGTIAMSAGNGATLGANTASLDTSAIAGVADNVGDSDAGDITVAATGGATVNIATDFLLNADAGQFSTSIPGNSGSATGGDIDFTADGGTITAGRFTATAEAASNNTTGFGAPAQGGTIDISATNAGSFSATDSAGTSFFSVDAASGVSQGGTAATGGRIGVSADGGTISFGHPAFFSATGIAAGDGSGSGNIVFGRGGSIRFEVLDNPANLSVITFQSIVASADGRAQQPFEGAGALRGTAAGNGGDIIFDVQGGQLTGGSIQLSASGFSGSVIGDQGEGRGGTAAYTQTGGAVNISDLAVSANGVGGGNQRAPTGGSGFGGTATIDLNGGTLDATTITAQAVGAGGVGTAGDDSDPANPVDGQVGGNGQGGTATINLNGTAVVTTTTLTASALGIGGNGGDFFASLGVAGNGGNGGDALGGTAGINLTQGTLNAGDITADASALGGLGGVLVNLGSGPPSGTVSGGGGGDAQGGAATINLATAVTATGTVSSLATALGGDGGTNNIGGDAGEARGGTAALILTNFNAGNVGVVLDASADGGVGGDGLDGAGGRGGYAEGGIARVQADGANARAVITDANFITTGTGGAGGNAALLAGNSPRFGPSGGNGGDGRGGTIELNANGGTIELGVGRLGVAALGSFGIGGDGGTGADNPGTMTLPGPDGMPGTMDDIIVGFVGGQGGAGGGGIGGTVRLAVIGGTITSNANPVAIVANGTSGAGGNGGAGVGGSVGAGGNFVDLGGTVILDASNTATNRGQISFGDTTIDAGGFNAGRVEILAQGSITMTSLTADAAGLANPTNSDTDLAPAGIFLGITDGGLVQTDGAATLTTGSSVGVYAQGDGQFNVGGNLTVTTDDQVDIRHDFRDGIAPTIQIGGSASFTAANSIRSAQGSLVSAGTSLSMNATGFNSAIDVDSLEAQTLTLLLAQFGRINVYGSTTSGDDLTANARDEVAINAATTGDDISLIGNTIVAGRLITTGAGLDSELDGSNIFFSTVGAASVDHAEADNDFTANVGRFATGPNSIITGGDIDITSVGAVDLGNSNAGGSVAVNGQSIVFDTITAGTTVGLTATGAAAVGEAILGNGINAGGDVTLSGASIRINDSVVTSASLFAFATGGNANLSATTDGDIFINTSGDIGGAFDAGGNINLTSAGNITAQANANGGYVGPNGVSEGYLFINATGTANVLAGSGAATMVGVRAGTNATVVGTTAGEDLYVIAGNTATVTNSVAGDDMILTGTCCVIVDNISTTGLGNTTRGLVFAPATAGGPDVWQIQASMADGANIGLTASAGTIDANNVVANANLTATASGVVTTTNTIRSGLATTIRGSALNLESVTAGTDILLTSTSGGIGAIGALSAGHDLTITSAAGGAFADLSAGDDIRINAAGNISAATLLTTAGGADNEADNSGAYINTPGNIVITGATNTVGQTRLTAGGTIDAGAITADFTVIDAVGAVNITGDITSGGIFVEGDSVAIRNANGRSNQIILRATGGNVTANGNVTTLAELTVQATGAIAITGAASGGNYVEMTGGSINVADVTSSSYTALTATTGAINSTGTISAGSDVVINAATGGQFNALIAGDDVSINAGGNVTIASITAEGSNPQGEEIGSNVSGSVNGVLTVTGSTFANDDVNFGATSMSLQSVEAGGAFTATSTGGPLSLAAGTAGTNIALTATGVVTATGPLQSGVDTTVSGASLALRGITAGGNVALTSTTGDIRTDGDVFGFNISYDAARDIIFDANDRAFANGTLFLDAGRDALIAGQLDADRDVTVQAVRNTNVNLVGAGDDVRITGGQSVTTGRVEATGGGIDNEGNGSNVVMISAGTLDTNGLVSAANTVSLRGASVDTLTVTGGTVGIISTVGDVNLGGNVTGFNGISIDSAGDILQARTNRIAAGGGPLTLTADGDIAIGDAVSGGGTGMLIAAVGTVDTGALTGAGNVQGGGAVTIGGNVRGGLFSVQGSSIDLGGNEVRVASANLTATGGDINSTGAFILSGGLTAVASGTAGLTGNIAAVQDVSITGASVNVGNVTSSNGSLILSARAGDLTTNALTSGFFTRLTASGSVTINGDMAVGQFFSAVGSSIDLTDADYVGGQFGVNALGGNVTGTGSIAANGSATVLAAGNVGLSGPVNARLGVEIQGNGLQLGDITSDLSFVALGAGAGGITSTGVITAGRDIQIGTSGGAQLNRLIAGDDIGVTGSGTVNIAFMNASGTNGDGEEIGSNAMFDVDGDVVIGHGEAADDFIVDATSFTTGLNSLITGGNIDITTVGASNLGNSTAGGSISVDAQSIAFNALNAGTTIDLNATGTAVGASGITGGQVTAGGNVTLYGNPASSTLTIGSVAAGGFVEARGGALAFGNVVAGTDAILSSFNGALSVGDVTAGDDIFLTVNGSNANPNTVSPDSQVGQVSSTQFALTTGNLRSTGLGSDTAVSGRRTFTGAGPTGNVIRVRASGAVQTGNVTTGGAAILASDLSTITAQTISAPGGVALFVRGNVTTGNIATAGALWVGDSSQYFLATPTYQVSNYPFFQTPTAGGATLGAVNAGLIRGSVLGDTSFTSLNSTGDILWSTGNSTTVGGSVSGGAVTAGGTLTIRAGGGLTFTDANAASNVLLIASTGAITGDTVVGDNVDLSAATGITVTDVESRSDATLGTSSGALTFDTISSDGRIFAGGGSFIGGTATAASNIVASAFAGDLSGTFNAGGDIMLTASGNVTATANAAGGFPDPNNGDVPSAGNVFIDATGDVVQNGSSAAGMFGINAGGSITLTGVTAGEDMLALAGSTATLTNVTVGDDLEVRAVGGIIATGARATAQGPDGFLLDYTANGFTIGQGEGVSTLDGADILLSSGGAINATNLSAGDDIVIAGTTIALNGATTLGLGQTGSGSNVSTQGGATTLANIDAFDDLRVQSSGAVAVTSPAATGRDIVITAASADFTVLADPSTNAINTLDAGRNLTVNTSGAITGGSIRANGNLGLSAGTMIGLGRAVTGAGGTMTLDGHDGIEIVSLISGGTTSANSSNGGIRIGTLSSQGPITLVGDGIFVNAVSGDAVFSNIQTDVSDAYILGGNNISITAGSVAGLALIRSDNNLNVTQLSANQIELSAAHDMVLGNVTAAQELAARTGDMLTVNGAVVGRNMLIASGDITIGSGGRLGTQGTTQGIEVRNIDQDSITYIGGTGTRGGYHLDATEMTRLFGNDITILAPDFDNNNGGFVAAAPGGLPIGSVGSSTPPTVIIDDFTITAGGPTSNLGANGSLTIATQGKARVIGDAALTGMGDANSFRINADDSIEVILGEGTIRLSGSSPTTPGGMLVLESDDVIVATAAAIADVGAATTTDAIDDRLAENDGILLDDGALFAGGMDVSVVGGFYVQNSGIGTRFAQRRGLTFGPLGLNVNVEGSATRIVINGVHLGPSGQVTGLDAIPLLSINGFVLGSGPLTGSGLAFDSASTMNGCLIVSSTTCAFLEFESAFPVQDVINDDDDDEGDGDDADGMSLPIPLITMRSLDPLTGQPLLDDPVTGAGNDDLWTPPSQ